MMTRFRRFALVAILGVGLVVSPASAQGRLSKATRLNCTFATKVVARWKNGDPQVETTPTSLPMVITDINIEEGTARTTDVLGTTVGIVTFASGTLHFMQTQTEGAVYLTSVFDKESHPGKLRAVHTRHAQSDLTLGGFTSSPEQYYGECTIEK